MTWPVQDAKARFSELLETCLREGPQLVTRRGKEAAVLVSMSEWQRLARSAKPTLKELLLTDIGRAEFKVAPRGKLRRRTPLPFPLRPNVLARYQRRIPYTPK